MHECMHAFRRLCRRWFLRYRSSVRYDWYNLIETMVTVSSTNTTMVKKIVGNLDNSRHGQPPSPYAECLKGPTVLLRAQSGSMHAQHVCNAASC